jgi:hypothetical protein
MILLRNHDIPLHLSMNPKNAKAGKRRADHPPLIAAATKVQLT